MPPKKTGQGPNKKTVEKKKEKVIEDKTFGLKNKKGKKQQQFIKHVTNQVKFGGSSQQKREAAEFQAKKDKVDRLKEKTEFDSLFRPVQQKISSGADPKSVLCLFFKQGQCTKGDKCKFSHDLSLEGKAEKRSMYVDSRDVELEEDTIDKWDEDKLKEVVHKKHATKTKPKTDIVCKHFLHAIEKAIYGWFWECPNGNKCIYRHALPPGFVFKKALKEQEEIQSQDALSLEELVETEREQLSASGKALTKVTLETFLEWKKAKIAEKKLKRSKEEASRKEAFKAGRTHGISGREMFSFNPNLMKDDDDEDDSEGVVTLFVRDDEDQEGGNEVAAIDLSDLEAVSKLAATGPAINSGEIRSQGQATNHRDESTESVTVEPSTETEGAQSPLTTDTGDVPIDESLFTGDDLIDNVECEGGGACEDGGGGSEVAVDESLFDIDNLQDLDLADPAILQPVS